MSESKQKTLAMGKRNINWKGHDFSNGTRYEVEEKEWHIPKGNSKYDFESGVDLVIKDTYDIGEKMDEEASQSSLQALLGKVALNGGDITILNQKKPLEPNALDKDGNPIFDTTIYADQANDMPEAILNDKINKKQIELATAEAEAKKKADEAAKQDPLQGMTTEQIEQYLATRKESENK